jgi:uncharacterized membrane protein YcaP (DUF421 family)
MHTLWVNLIQLGASNLAVPYAEKIIRPVAVYLLLVFGLKKFGRRVLAQLNPFDFVVLLMLSNTVQNAIIGNDTSLAGGFVGAAALLAVNALLVRVYYRGPLQTQMENENDVVLIDQYQVQDDALRRFRINRGELTARAHERGFDTLDEVEMATLYPNGTIYMKGESQDSVRIRQILAELEELRQELAMRRG